MDYKTLVCRIDVMYAVDINYNKKKLSYRKKKSNDKNTVMTFFRRDRKVIKLALPFSCRFYSVVGNNIHVKIQ